MSFNLSEWALRNRSIVIYFMIVAVLAGLLAYYRLGRNEEARRYYTHALKIRPDEPTVLSNLGMSYVLSKQLPQAEETLRRAHDIAPSDARVTQNLALVVGLQGRAAEAETIVSAGLSPQEASESIEGLRAMLRNGNARRSGGKQRAEAHAPSRS